MAERRTAVSEQPAVRSSPWERELRAETLLDRLTPVMSALGLIFLLVVLGEQFARPGTALEAGLAVVGWVLWAVFAGEFVARLVVTPDTGRYLRTNWWQALFLVLPFLRVLRLVRAVRVLRTSRVLSSAVRSARSARSLLGSRIGWLAMLCVIVVLSSSQLLFQFGDYPTYGDALHEATLAAITGQPLGQDGGLVRLVELVLVVFSVAVFATLAGSLGAYFLHGSQESAAAARED